MRDELKAFAETRKRKPEYYVFVTNVELSSVEDGARDQADKIIQSYQTQLPLKGYAIWDANQLAAYLDKYEAIRRRFVSYLTPGDVLAAMLARIERFKSNEINVLTSFLTRELRADAMSRLDQAGDRTEDYLQLSNHLTSLMQVKNGSNSSIGSVKARCTT